MVSINYATREVTCKIVYYGPGLSGKTTNLIYVHKKVPATTRGKMISLATEADRTLYFDFLPINIGKINGFTAKFQLYTVPGQVYYNATRKLVLRGADGLVFVADSQAEKMDENIESLTNLKENLAEYGYSADEMPIVIQYNKRDLPGILSIPELEAKLNPKGWKHFEAEAVTGKGVFDTLKMIIKLVLEKAKTTRPATVQPSKEAVSSPEATRVEPSAAMSQSQPAAEYVPPTPSIEPQQPMRQTVYEPSSGAESESSVSPEVARGIEYNSLKEEKVAEEPVSKYKPPEAGIGEEMPVSVGESQQRPYPGTTTSKILRRERRITVSDFQPASKDDESPAYKGHFVGDVMRQEDAAGHSLPLPSMAPAQRMVKKKQGFFKRLFGIK
jgi:signal recognition particle receptor subunit beta